ncbi:hypothetical protein NEMBOFW57_004532 [Staphylotrichum longicolle]|uniref:Clr5 domain-containing protein n=1 Tax=Staphylotrichum longicolle TaxID=669026 RepID=A0AAD4F851_9PEZI|nr:hypothetical protein NEMBOFW57_004532 [Staphylotrichum longicolle]
MADYGSESSYKRRYPKRKSSQVGKQTRNKSTPERSAEIVAGPIIKVDDFDLHWHMFLSVPYPLEVERFTHHEHLLHAVDCFIRGIFDTRNKGWSASTTSFLGPGGNDQSPLYYQWRSISDRCHSVALLVRAGQQGKAEATLEQLFQELGNLVEHRHPAFMVSFWRLCLRLLGVDTHIPQANAVRRLLSLVKACRPENDPAALIAASLSAMVPGDLRNALRIGYLKAIRTMGELIGDENIMVLEMASYYCKFFDTPYLVREALLGKFEFVWHKTYDGHAERSRPAIAVAYAYAYAAYYVLDRPLIAIDMGVKLRDTAAGHSHLAEPARARWTLETEAFAFASKTVAEMYRQQVSRAGNLACAADQFAKCCASMQGAILKLEKGDRECRTRAGIMSATLNRWLVEWGLQQQAEEEAIRARRILNSVEGKMCRGNTCVERVWS